MIDTDKYEGHTEGEWRVEPSGINRVMVYTDDEGFSYKVSNRNLVADAPKLLAEVKRLREDIEGYKAIWNYLDPKGYAWEEEAFVALLEEHGFETGEEE